MNADDKIFANRLTTFEITPDGSRFCMNVADETGQARGLSLPAECLVQLIMTLPEMASKALKMRYRDDTLRIVYRLGTMRVEAAHINEVTILTLATQDGFTVSFGLTADDLKRLERTAREARTGTRPDFVKN
jgi:hypothetical protein